MLHPELEYEWEVPLEAEWEGEWEEELELEGDGESEEFFRSLAALARRAIASPTGQRAIRAVRKTGLKAARSALSGLADVGGAIGGAPGTWGTRLGTAAGGGLGALLGSFLPEGEYEQEWELEAEAPLPSALQTEALMEHLGHAAAEAESEAEAEAFIGALVPLAAKLIPKVAPMIMRAAPQLIRGVSSMVRTLRRSPGGRPLVRAVPQVVRRTAASLARQSAAGAPVGPGRAVRTLANQAAHVLGNPQRAVQAYRRSRSLDRRFHRLCRELVCPK